MKKLFLATILLATPLVSFSYTSPGRPQGFVNDFAKILTAAEVQKLESHLEALEQNTGAQITVVTVPSLGDETVETYAVQLFEEWGIGDAAKDRGLLILVAPAERQVRIEVGYGLEGDITDLQSGEIIRDIVVPAFQKGSYAIGIEGAVDAMGAILTNSPEAARGTTQNPNYEFNPGFLFFIVIIFFNIFARILGKSKSWWLGGVIGAIIGGIIGLIWGFLMTGLISVIILTILGLLFDFIVSKRPPGDGHGGHFPFFGGFGGHGGGGFGGFGGGMSGGGGASGRW